VGARAASAAEARRLQGHKGEPLLTMSRTTYNENGQPVELGDHIYRASLYSFEIVLVSR
jgi:DNA-binding GntR family transcriptional regulator